MVTEIWDVNAHTVQTIEGEGIGRSGHTATLMSDAAGAEFTEAAIRHRRMELVLGAASTGE